MKLVSGSFSGGRKLLEGCLMNVIMQLNEDCRQARQGTLGVASLYSRRVAHAYPGVEWG